MGLTRLYSSKTSPDAHAHALLLYICREEKRERERVGQLAMGVTKDDVDAALTSALNPVHLVRE